MRWTIKLFFFAVLMMAQYAVAESKLGAEFRREGERAADACGGGFQLQTIPKCGYTLFTDHPLHIAAGSMPPQNGFGIGAAFVTWKNVTNWRINWNADAVGATSGAWRAGAYMKLVHTPKQQISVSQPGTSRGSGGKPFVHPYTVFNLYVQSISLNHVNFFGLGNNTALAGETQFGMRQTIVGANVIKPVFEIPALRKLNLALVGEVNGRFVNIRGSHDSVPSIEAIYNDATAPGLSHQPGFIQFGEGVRIKPAIGDRLQFDYLGSFQQFAAPSDSTNSFLRWTVDLNHTLALYRNQKAIVTGGADNKGPDTCATSGENCPELPHTRNLQGSIGVRLLVSESITSATSAVPFYFQPTLGGQDLNSSLVLGSYRDYRFRAPNILVLQEYIEHSIWGPFGAKLMADQGRVALTRGELGFSHLRHSFAGGLTLRAGAFPMVSLMFAWGGGEGHHNIVNMNTSLLGSSNRPSLF